jgi:outer membrane murein-binding lipoprotein Lpp
MGRIAMKQQIMIVVLGGLLLAGCIGCNTDHPNG